MKKILIILSSVFLLLLFLLASYKLIVVVMPLTENQEATMSFLQKNQELTLPYTSAEVSHLQDVKKVMQMADTLFFLLIVGTVLILLFSWKYHFFQEIIQKSSVASCLLLVILTLLVPLSFTSSFTLFHNIFFPQGNWVFPVDSLLIQTFPFSFFNKIGILIFVVAFLLAVIFLLGSYFPRILNKLKKASS